MKKGHHVFSWGVIEPFRDDIVSIGNYVIIGNSTRIITHCPIKFYNNKPLDINIGDVVYIGAHCIVLPNVNIGSYVIIGAGSVVTKDIPSGVIAAGNPCKVIRNLTESEKNRLKLLIEQEQIADGTEPLYLEEEYG